MTDSRREETIGSRPPISTELKKNLGQNRENFIFFIFYFSIYTFERNVDIIRMNDLIGDFA